MSYGNCPTCNEPGVTTCRCRAGDTRCKNGHHWHRFNGEIHFGPWDHGKDPTNAHSHAACVRAHARERLHTGADVATALPPVASSQPVPVAPAPAVQSGPGMVAKAMDVLWMGCFVAVPVGGVMYLAGRKELGKKVAKVGAIGALAPVAVAVGYVSLWALSGMVKK